MLRFGNLKSKYRGQYASVFQLTGKYLTFIPSPKGVGICRNVIQILIILYLLFLGGRFAQEYPGTRASVAHRKNRV
jgi:hypothetical protein